MRKILMSLIILMMVTSSCQATNFSSLIGIGYISGTPIGGFRIEGTSYNNGTSYKNGKFNKEWGTLYEKGLASYGEGNAALYVHYDCSYSPNRSYSDAYTLHLGDKNKIKTIAIPSGEGYQVAIYRIENDTKKNLYLLYSTGASVERSTYILLGRREDGIFVKYFDTRDVIKNYFGGNRSTYVKNVVLYQDTIIIEYERLDNKEKGSFKFKWDDAAQWFSVEHIV